MNFISTTIFKQPPHSLVSPPSSCLVLVPLSARLLEHLGNQRNEKGELENVRWRGEGAGEKGRIGEEEDGGGISVQMEDSPG